VGGRPRGAPLQSRFVILIDSSAWIEFLRDTGSTACLRVDELLGTDIAVCEPVWMEILAGARDDRHLADLRKLLARATLLATESIDFEEAAGLYRICRRQGETPRKMIDCLIAAIAIRSNVPVLHADEDFEVLARYTVLMTDRGRRP
jgi:predicted nucleic acid-binding protein